MDGREAKPGYKARFAAASDPAGLELLIEVSDPVHHPEPEGITPVKVPYWAGDSVEFAIDCVGKGLPNDLTEFIASGCGDRLMKTRAAAVGGDLPDRYTATRGEPLRYARWKLERREGVTVYKIHIDASELYPFTFRMDQPLPLRFSLQVNNNDGAGRTGYLAWADGIFGPKDPVKYGTLYACGSGRTVAGMEVLRRSFLKAKVETFSDGVKVRSLLQSVNGEIPDGGSGVGTTAVAVTPGLRYRVEFEARGRGVLEMFAAGKGVPRTRLQKGNMPLSGDWRRFEGEVIIPPGGQDMQLNLFTWKQPESEFEVRRFKIIEAK